MLTSSVLFEASHELMSFSSVLLSIVPSHTLFLASVESGFDVKGLGSFFPLFFFVTEAVDLSSISNHLVGGRLLHKRLLSSAVMD